MKSIARPRSPILWRVALLTTVLLALAARFVPGERTIDDAYITFRYARNLLAGEGFVYNPGQHVQGTTTPLYTLLMVAARGVLPAARLPALALVANALADVGSVIVLARLGQRRLQAPGLGIAAGLLWALSPRSVTFSIGGMETSVYVLLLLLALASYAGGRSRWSALWCALATLTRPDALLLVVPLFAHMAWERVAGVEDSAEKRPNRSRGFHTARVACEFPRCAVWKPRLQTSASAFFSRISQVRPTTGAFVPIRGFPWIEIAIYGLTLAPWLLFSTLYFGSPLAHSVVAKSAAYRLEPYSALVRLIQHYATPFSEHETLGTGWVAVGSVLYLFLSLLGGWAMVRRRSAPGTGAGSAARLGLPGRLFPLVVYPWLYFLAFGLYNPLLFRWYLAPILPMYTLCILYGAHRLLSDLAGAARRRVPTATDAVRRAVHILASLLIVAAVGMQLNAWTLHPDHGPGRPAPKMAWFKLELLYQRAALDLMASQEITAETRIAAGDIGVIGYVSGARILDTVGLVSPEAVGYYPLPETAYAIAYAVSADLILDQRPDYAIMLEVYARNTLQRSQAFAEAYEVYRRWPTDIYGSEGLLVYRRRELGE
jgi:Gpi18-like mannosyltransferase